MKPFYLLESGELTQVGDIALRQGKSIEWVSAIPGGRPAHCVILRPIDPAVFANGNWVIEEIDKRLKTCAPICEPTLRELRDWLTDTIGVTKPK